MKSSGKELAVQEQNEIDAVENDRGLLAGPRPTVDREKLQYHLG